MKTITVYYPASLVKQMHIERETEHLKSLLMYDNHRVDVAPYNNADDIQGPSFFILEDSGEDQMNAFVHTVAIKNQKAIPYFDEEIYIPGEPDRHEHIQERARKL